MSTRLITPVAGLETIKLLDQKQENSLSYMLGIYFSDEAPDPRLQHFAEASFGLIYRTNFEAKGRGILEPIDSLMHVFPWIDAVCDDIHSRLIKTDPALVPVVEEISNYFGDHEQRTWINRNIQRWFSPAGAYSRDEIWEGVALGRFTLKQK